MADVTCLTVQQLPVDSLRSHPKIWPRKRLDEGRVAEFAEILRDGDEDQLPPIAAVADPRNPNCFWIVDGVTRFEAHKRVGRAVCQVELLALPCTYAALFPEAVRRSAVSSKPLSRAEKRSAVARLVELHPTMSDREVARLAGVSHPTVGAYRRDGKFAGHDRETDSGDREPAEPVGRLLASLARAVWRGSSEEVSVDDFRDFVTAQIDVARDDDRPVLAARWIDLAARMGDAVEHFREVF
jgi:hypothetical protein